MRSLLCFFLACLAVFANDITCPPGYTSKTLIQNNATVPYCYKVYITYFNRQQAVAQCALDGATLAVIASPEENQMYVDADQISGSLTIGLSCLDNNHCIFDDGTPFNRSAFDPFSGGEIRSDLGQCVELETMGVFAGRWSNIPCTMLGSFACSYKPKTCSTPVVNSNVTQQSGCNSFYVMSPDSGPITITSPNYPSNYDNDQTCAYFFKTSRHLNITFTDFYTEGGYDRVRVNDGGYMLNATLIREISGTPGAVTVLTANNEALITFTSDQSTVARGFSAIVTSF